MHYSFPTKSKGHIAWLLHEKNEPSELYGDGTDLFIAPMSSVLDVNTGYRIGRWECQDTPARRAYIFSLYSEEQILLPKEA